ncbi:HNH endonuclease [Bacillus alkalicellulosilyticus]|uniref:HNH endonuclease n=1 Tax=Alkalihalobacterium alkalicellulosilyticum TaxID=1912214 RepID=UPI00099869A2|nr:HNH endonuclease [Bacillus alkalicellulosilyticus]
MKRKLLQKIGDTSGKVVGGLLGGSIKLAAKAVKSEYVQEVGDSVYKASHFTCHTIGGLSQGVVDTASGLIKKDKEEVYEGLSEIGGTTLNATKVVGKGIAYTAKSSIDVASGVVKKDRDKTKQGLNNLGKVAAVGTIAFGVVDVIDGATGVEAADSSEIQTIDTINSDLAGQLHPVSGVPFESTIVELPDGSHVEGVFPVFESAFDAQLDPEFYEASDYMHAQLANDQLSLAIQQDPSVGAPFNEIQLEQIHNGDTPDGFTWHHHEEMGRIQLVETEPHDQSGHSGGRSLWGGGSDNR